MAVAVIMKLPKMKYIKVASDRSFPKIPTEIIFNRSTMMALAPSPSRQIFMYLCGNLGYKLVEVNKLTALNPIIIPEHVKAIAKNIT